MHFPHRSTDADCSGSTRFSPSRNSPSPPHRASTPWLMLLSHRTQSGPRCSRFSTSAPRPSKLETPSNPSSPALSVLPSNIIRRQGRHGGCSARTIQKAYQHPVLFFYRNPPCKETRKTLEKKQPGIFLFQSARVFKKIAAKDKERNGLRPKHGLSYRRQQSTRFYWLLVSLARCLAMCSRVARPEKTSSTSSGVKYVRTWKMF